MDRFADSSIWERLPTGEPYLPCVHAWIRGRIVNKINAGRSTVVIAEALQTKVSDSEEAANNAKESAPLAFHNQTWHRLGAVIGNSG